MGQWGTSCSTCFETDRAHGLSASSPWSVSSAPYLEFLFAPFLEQRGILWEHDRMGFRWSSLATWSRFITQLKLASMFLSVLFQKLGNFAITKWRGAQKWENIWRLPWIDDLFPRDLVDQILLYTFRVPGLQTTLLTSKFLQIRTFNDGQQVGLRANKLALMQ